MCGCVLCVYMIHLFFFSHDYYHIRGVLAPAQLLTDYRAFLTAAYAYVFWPSLCMMLVVDGDSYFLLFDKQT